MMILLVLAGALLALSAALFFGPQFVAYGPHGLRMALARPEAQIVGAGLITALSVLLFGSPLLSALIPGGEAVQVVA